MFPKYHFILGIIFAGLIFIFSPKVGLIGFLLLFSSSFFVDIDHYIFYIYKKKDLSLRKAYAWFLDKHKKCLSIYKEKRHQFNIGFFIFHGIEILLILLVFSFIFEYFLFIFLGASFHLLTDFFYQSFFSNRLERISLINDFINYEKFKGL